MTSGRLMVDVPLPTESGKFTVANLAASVRPILARMCDALSESRTADPEAPGGFKVQTIPVNAAHLRSLIVEEGTRLAARVRRGTHFLYRVSVSRA